MIFFYFSAEEESHTGLEQHVDEKMSTAFYFWCAIPLRMPGNARQRLTVKL